MARTRRFALVAAGALTLILVRAPDAGGPAGDDTADYPLQATTIGSAALATLPSAAGVDLPTAGPGTPAAPAGPSSPADADTRFLASWSPSGLDGGGFQNVVVKAGSVLLAGGDNAGVHRSVDAGRTWTASNRGLGQIWVAGLFVHQSDPNRIYAAVGRRAVEGGVYVSTDGGQSWALRSETPRFSGGNNPMRMPCNNGNHPRSTGRVLIRDSSNGYLYAATYHDGVMRSSDDGETWTTIGLAGSYLRSIEEGGGDTLFVAATNGVYRITGASTPSPGTERMSGGPAEAEELRYLNGVLWVAAQDSGAYTYTESTRSWTPLRLPSGPVGWQSVDVYLDGGTTHTFFGSCLVGDSNASVVHSRDGGASWKVLTDTPAGVHNEQGGPGGPPWWEFSAMPEARIDGNQYVASFIEAEPGLLLVAGRAGIWKSTDVGANWYPANRYLNVTINPSVATNGPGRVCVGNMDHTVMCSADGGTTFTNPRPAGSAGVGYGVTFDTDGDFYLAAGPKEGAGSGEVWRTSDPFAGRVAWIGEGLSELTGGRRPLAVVARHNILLVAVEQSGIWFKLGSTWARVNSQAFADRQPDTGGSFAWLPGTPYVFAYDQQTGVWRSTNAGVRWELMWAQPSPSLGTGHLAVNPDAPQVPTLYVSNERGVWMIPNAQTANPQAIPVGSWRRPGPIAFHGGRLLVTEPENYPTSAPALLATQDGGARWAAVSGTQYQATAHKLEAMASDGVTLYVALRGNGVLRGFGP
ncbi:MAG: WD40/YVTN/BNR-like repeat-containing protein [Acidimicrobiales bacterium]